MIIGVDFDNTVVGYDKLIYDEALKRGLITSEVQESKKEIRDRIRAFPDGEDEWQRVQASVYGPRMNEAELIDGVGIFFERCHQNRVKTFIISHKTEYANFDETGTHLRQAALSWMQDRGFFVRDRFGLTPEEVFFGATRQEKIDHIKRLGCTYFIDDLEEVFLEDTFPEHVKKILFSPHSVHSMLSDIRIIVSWEGIVDFFFNTAC